MVPLGLIGLGVVCLSFADTAFVYLTTTDADFAESRKYFDAMAESFQLKL